MSMQEIGDTLRKRRKTLGITQASLADLAGVNTNTVIRIENGKINPKIGVVKSIAVVLGMELVLRVKQQAE